MMNLASVVWGPEQLKLQGMAGTSLTPFGECLRQVVGREEIDTIWRKTPSASFGVNVVIYIFYLIL